MAALDDLLHQIAEERRTLTRAEARAALHAILLSDPAAAPDPASDQAIADLLTLMAQRGESVDELTGFAEAMRTLSIPVPLTHEERAALVDTCGTGGDGRGT